MEGKTPNGSDGACTLDEVARFRLFARFGCLLGAAVVATTTAQFRNRLLIRCLLDSDEVVRVRAAEILTARLGLERIERVCSPLEDDIHMHASDPGPMRYFSLLARSDTASEALDVLHEVLMEKVAGWRAIVLAASAFMGTELSPRCVQLLREAVLQADRKDTDRYDEKLALSALRKFSGTRWSGEAFAVLAELGRGANGTRREHYFLSFVEFAPHLTEGDLDEVKVEFAKTDSYSRQWLPAVKACGVFAQTPWAADALKTLREFVDVDKHDTDLCDAAVWAATAFAPTILAPHALAFLTDDLDVMLCRDAGALGRFARTRVAQKAFDKIEDILASRPKGSDCRNAVLSLGSFAGTELESLAFEHLRTRNLKDADWLKGLAYGAMGFAQTARAAEAFAMVRQSILHCPDDKCWAVRNLGKFVGTAAEADAFALLRKLAATKEYGYIFNDVTWALGSFAGTAHEVEALEILRRLAKHPVGGRFEGPRIRLHAAWVMCRFGGEEVRQEIIAIASAALDEKEACWRTWGHRLLWQMMSSVPRALNPVDPFGPPSDAEVPKWIEEL